MPIFGLIAFEDGGCAALEGSGGFGCEGSVSRVVGYEGHKGSNGWQALLSSLSQRRVKCRHTGIWVLYLQDRVLMRLTAPQMPTMGSTEDQMTTQTKFPGDLTSADSVSRTLRITCHVGRVYSGEADNSNNADEADTVNGMSG